MISNGFKWVKKNYDKRNEMVNCALTNDKQKSQI